MHDPELLSQAREILGVQGEGPLPEDGFIFAAMDYVRQKTSWGLDQLRFRQEDDWKIVESDGDSVRGLEHGTLIDVLCHAVILWHNMPRGDGTAMKPNRPLVD